MRDSHRAYALLSPRECHTSLIDIPPVPDSEIGKLVKYQLRSEYPGNGASDIDWRRTGRRSVIAFAAALDRLSVYRESSPGIAFYASFSLARNVAGKKTAVVALSYDGRQEVFGFNRRKLVAWSQTSFAELAEAMEETASALSRPGRTAAAYVISDGPAPVALAQAGMPVTVVSVEQALVKTARAERPLFVARSHRRNRMKRIVLALLVVGIVIGLTVGVWRSFAAVGRAEEHLAAALSDAQQAYNEAISIADEIAILESTAGGTGGPLHPYEMISEIAGSLDSTVRIEQLTIRGSRFELSARGASGLDSLEALRKNPLVATANIRQVTSLDGLSGELFVLTGTFRE